MGNTKEPRDYGPEIQQLKNGKTFVVAEVVEQTELRYRATKRLFNLRKLTRNGRAMEIGLSRKNKKPVASKYTREEAQWLIENNIHAIAARYQCSPTKAYAIRHYARRIYGL